MLSSPKERVGAVAQSGEGGGQCESACPPGQQQSPMWHRVWKPCYELPPIAASPPRGREPARLLVFSKIGPGDGGDGALRSGVSLPEGDRRSKDDETWRTIGESWIS